MPLAFAFSGLEEIGPSGTCPRSSGLFLSNNAGTTTENRNTNTAIIKLCYKLNIPIVTAAVEGTRDILPRYGKYFKFLQKVVLKFNHPLYPKDFINEDDYAFACWEKVKSTHNDILKEFFPEKVN